MSQVGKTVSWQVSWFTGCVRLLVLGRSSSSCDGESGHGLWSLKAVGKKGPLHGSVVHPGRINLSLNMPHTCSCSGWEALSTIANTVLFSCHTHWVQFGPQVGPCLPQHFHATLLVSVAFMLLREHTKGHLPPPTDGLPLTQQHDFFSFFHSLTGIGGVLRLVMEVEGYWNEMITELGTGNTKKLILCVCVCVACCWDAEVFT